MDIQASISRLNWLKSQMAETQNTTNQLEKRKEARNWAVLPKYKYIAKDPVAMYFKHVPGSTSVPWQDQAYIGAVLVVWFVS